MRHEGGFAKVPEQVSFEDMKTENIKKNSIGKKFETAKPLFPTNAHRQYHVVARDWLSNEIFRRVEPEGRTYAEYYR